MESRIVPVSVSARHLPNGVDALTLRDSRGSQITIELAPGDHGNKVAAGIIEEIWWFLMSRTKVRPLDGKTEGD